MVLAHPVVQKRYMGVAITCRAEPSASSSLLPISTQATTSQRLETNSRHGLPLPDSHDKASQQPTECSAVVQ